MKERKAKKATRGQQDGMHRLVQPRPGEAPPQPGRPLTFAMWSQLADSFAAYAKVRRAAPPRTREGGQC